MMSKSSAEPVLSFAEVESAVRGICNPPQGQTLAYLDAMRRYLLTKDILRISDSTLARISSKYGKSRDGYAEEVVSIIAEEQERRRQAVAALSQATSDKALRWAKGNAIIAGIGAIAAIVAAIASIEALTR